MLTKRTPLSLLFTFFPSALSYFFNLGKVSLQTCQSNVNESKSFLTELSPLIKNQFSGFLSSMDVDIQVKLT